MAKLAVKTTSEIEPKWHSFIDEGDGLPVEFLISPITVAAQAEIDRLVKDREYIKSLNIDWSILPKWNMDRRQETRKVLFADYLFKGWRRVYEDDETTPLECSLYNKVWMLERQDLGNWAIERGQEGNARQVKDEAKNS